MSGACVQALFDDAELYTQRYQRNNKRSGLKNLRCFPMCTDSHRLRGFCGRPCSITVKNPECKTLLSYACFLKLPSSEEIDSGLRVGTEMSIDEISCLLRTKTDPFRPWILGELFDEDEDDSLVDDQVVRFAFNKSKKGWHYSWVANKHTCDSEHVLRAYIFEKIDAKTVVLISTVDSPAFTIFCRRRQRQNLDRLPPQLKVQLELQDAMKKGEKTCTNRKLPRSISLDGMEKQTKALGKRKSTPAVLTPPNPVPRRTGRRKRSRTVPCESSIPDSQTPPAAGIPEKVKRTTNLQRQHLLFHIMRSLMRLDVKDSSPVLSVAELNEISLMGQQQSIPTPVKLEEIGEMEDFSQSIAECLDCFAGSTLQRRQQPDEGSDSRSTISTELAAVEDFEPFDLDLSVLGKEGVGCCDEPLSVDFGDIMKEFADYLIQEHAITEEVEQSMASLGPDASRSQLKKMGVTLLVKLLTTFLKRYNISVDALYYLFKTQVWDPKNEGSLEGEGDELVSPQIGVEVEESFIETVQYYTKTVGNSCRQSSPRCVGDLSVLDTRITRMVDDCASETTPAGSPMPSFIPDSDPRNDFSGEWIRETETLNILENIRESIGVPWMLRKMLRYMELNLSMKHEDGCLIAQVNRKLLSSGYQRYILDGKEHPWLCSLPIPSSTPLSKMATYEATLKDGTLRIVHNYTKLKRILRETVKTECGNRLDSYVRFQYRDSLNHPWEDRLCTKCAAVRVSPLSEMTHEQAGSKESEKEFQEQLSWLTAPIGDFTFSM
uniref:Uncharacterized protein n=1 Tax=Mucochytrium quahogii TaxID=96639 RepID=A0A7S2SPT3_9STRA|mmetsp:Transcript_25755/g.41603  ORF Transcript_25755/g.41603 Transcript_25755/m.41603 type:complete len:774 (-) Transcript_25755:722-3043(-)|eukprot:CAMPEP_0203749748 /NCGR_PEP_ID=MMETSP0098-20131031/4180_1 /ASSEMBLY_ACC=CAM_ASM_000208 /TAXON_ID=96639 /ORGANISM=" , Strain NY0313808BC1" /LENGTH=773 /DNA_ID=CAMNT_0050638843 /DNA_START=234 /DNA_END=2555 /DNA_ORIENTATION=+